MALDLTLAVLGVVLVWGGPRRDSPTASRRCGSCQPRELQEAYSVGQHASWLLTTGDILGYAAAGAIGVQIAMRRSDLHVRARSLVDEASRAIGFPVLAALVRFRAGGTWLTPMRVLDEHRGLRSELRPAEAGSVTPRSQSVHVTPVHPSAARRPGHRHLRYRGGPARTSRPR